MIEGWFCCRVCGYIYKPEIGDAVLGIKPGTPFTRLPNDWVCPVCFAEKKVFFSFKKE
ncbi:MAG: rubredoxin [Candidatus Heimdallarchaeota archaeon]|nr:rubredoxin [Candidatus Heimdallarchaeota archaeon]